MDAEGLQVCVCAGEVPHEVSVHVGSQHGVDGQVHGDVERGSDLVKACRRSICVGDGLAGDVPLQVELAISPW